MSVPNTFRSPALRLYHQTAPDFAVHCGCLLFCLGSSNNLFILLYRLVDNLGHCSATRSHVPAHIARSRADLWTSGFGENFGFEIRKDTTDLLDMYNHRTPVSGMSCYDSI